MYITTKNLYWIRVDFLHFIHPTMPSPHGSVFSGSLHMRIWGLGIFLYFSRYTHTVFFTNGHIMMMLVGFRGWLVTARVFGVNHSKGDYATH